jgi:aspartate/methionine/tyrosine aminotransferase
MVFTRDRVKTPMKPTFSKRIHWGMEENDLARALARKRAAGDRILDLTESNPTRAGLPYPASPIRKAFDDEALLRYVPDPRGDENARMVVSRYYRDRGADVSEDDVFLTASTSEAYSFLFKLLCDAGDEVLVPRPSYPLFDFLAALDEVRPVSYPLRFDGAWHMDFAALEDSMTEKSRAIIAVHPNNPTGSYVSSEDRERLLDLGLPLIVDEVFLDFPLSKTGAFETFARSTRGLVFVLSGLSKLAGLPQMKLGWIVIAGDRENRKEAALRLEHIADSYLSVGAPVQVAAPTVMKLAPAIRRSISDRTTRNLDSLQKALASAPAVTLLVPQGGWYVPLRLPAVHSSEEWALSLLEEESVYVHPGSFFGFDVEAYLVVSLLTPEDVFVEGVRRALRSSGAGS